MCKILKDWFGHLSELQLQVLLLRAIKESNDYKAFKSCIKDLMLTTEQSSAHSEFDYNELQNLVNQLGPDWI